MDAIVWILMSEDVMSRSQASWRRGKRSFGALCCAVSGCVYGSSKDLSTVHKDKLPHITEKGMCLQYAVTHEDFAWAIRGEPGVIDAFEKVYNDKDLIVSFDAVNFGFPK